IRRQINADQAGAKWVQVALDHSCLSASIRFSIRVDPCQKGIRMATDWQPTGSTEALELRARLNAEVRGFFAERGVLEVETPVMSRGGNTEPNIASFTVDF